MVVVQDGMPNDSFDLEAKVAFLRRPQAYPHAPDAVSVIETHKSFVFLAGPLVYKLKKPIRYNAVNLESLEARYANSLEEVRLNRRLAPSVYLDAVPLVRDASGLLALDTTGEPVDWLVKMRRLPPELMLDHLILDRRFRAEDIRPLAVRLSTFYQSCRPLRISGSDYRALLEAEIERTADALFSVRLSTPPALIEAVLATLRSYLAELAGAFDQRASMGRVVDGHGDLRPEHVCLETVPLVIDCLEFDPNLRIVDPVDELSFLAMGCARIGAPDVWAVLYDTYARMTGDRAPQDLHDFYTAYRASIWARLAAWRLPAADSDAQGKWLARAGEYLAIAARYTKRLLDHSGHVIEGVARLPHLAPEP